jgi:hypothetical protein
MRSHKVLDETDEDSEHTKIMGAQWQQAVFGSNPGLPL